MTYPKTILTRKIRLTIMGTLITLFFIISPLVIMYTAGYRWDFEKKEIKQTGVLSIDIEPDDASVYLNNIEIRKNLPLYLPNRAPGTYKIKLKLPGYRTWEKNINIESKQTTYIKDITLLKDTLPVYIDLPNLENIEKVFFSNSGQYALITNLSDNIYEIYLINLENNSTKLISRILQKNNPQISWSPFADFFTLKFKTLGQTKIQIFSARNLELTNTYSFSSIKSFQWSRNDSMPTIFLQSQGLIYLLSASTQKTFAISDADIWHIDYFDNLWIYDKEKKNLFKFKKDELLSTYFINENLNKIIDINEFRILVKSNNNITAMKFDDEKIYQKNTLATDKIFFNQNRKEWITWSQWELWNIDNNGNCSLLNRTGEKINTTRPMDKYGLLLTSSENKLSTFDPRYFITQDLFTNGHIKNLNVNNKDRKIFFFGEVAGKKGLFGLEY